MKQIEAIIFDMDGVIADSEPLHEQAFLDVFEEMGYLDRHSVDFPAYYGKSDETLWRDFIARHRPPQSLDELMERKLRRFLEIIREKEPIFETLPELVAKLSRRYKLGLASGSLHAVIDAVLAMRNLRQFFSVRVSAQDVTRGKPAPDIFLRAASLLEMRSEACCVIEDSTAGVQGALAARMRVIAITNTFPAERLTAATHVVRTYQEIERLLL